MLGQLHGRPAGADLRRLTLAGQPALRLGLAIALGVALAIAAPAALYGAVSLQKLVEALQARS